jgi:hypothetical protein
MPILLKGNSKKPASYLPSCPRLGIEDQCNVNSDDTVYHVSERLFSTSDKVIQTDSDKDTKSGGQKHFRQSP